MSAQEKSRFKARPFDFSSFGVKVRFEGDSQQLIDQAAEMARVSLVGNVTPLSLARPDVTFELGEREDGQLIVKEDGELAGADGTPEYFFRFFNTLLRIAVAERAVERVFMHAGAVAWNGKGVIFPGTSFVGKSTLVAELVRQGAVYYSDDYAIFDDEGRLYPFPRMLSMRKDDERFTRYELTPTSLGGQVGKDAIEVGTIVLTRYEENAVWDPRRLTSGEGVLEMIQYTFAFKDRPNFSLPVLNNLTRRAIVISSLRGSAETFAKTLLDFIDKNEI